MQVTFRLVENVDGGAGRGIDRRPDPASQGGLLPPLLHFLAELVLVDIVFAGRMPVIHVRFDETRPLLADTAHSFDQRVRRPDGYAPADTRELEAVVRNGAAGQTQLDAPTRGAGPGVGLESLDCDVISIAHERGASRAARRPSSSQIAWTSGMTRTSLRDSLQPGIGFGAFAARHLEENTVDVLAPGSRVETASCRDELGDEALARASISRNASLSSVTRTTSQRLSRTSRNQGNATDGLAWAVNLLRKPFDPGGNAGVILVVALVPVPMLSVSRHDELERVDGSAVDAARNLHELLGKILDLG